MSWTRTVRVLLVVAALGSGSPLGGSEIAAQGRRGAPVPPSLAKARLAAATTAAKAWKPDAVLIQIGGRGVGPDGMRVIWDYGYWSATAKTCVVVNVVPAGASTDESGGAACQAPELKEPFIDSDRAMTIARMSGITAPTATMFLSASGKGSVWAVMDGGGTASGNVLLDIDAVSGAVLNKTSQR